MRTNYAQKHSQVPSTIDRNQAQAILEATVPLHEAFSLAVREREHYCGKEVLIHILDNIQNGRCAEDCGYCAQRRSASGVETYPLKSDTAIFEDARRAKETGAYRFCMVSSGTGPSKNTTERLAKLIHRISTELALKVCLSAGAVDKDKAQILAEAGLDRYNHNLNTSDKHYDAICSTHTFGDRLQTLTHLAEAGVGLCSGVIVGLGESMGDLIDVAYALKKIRAASIPVNFFIPVPGHRINYPTELTPEFCLRVLIVFRLVNPDSEIRLAAGREGHLRTLQAMALMVANSLFVDGYLNVKGSKMEATLALIHDAGLTPVSSGDFQSPAIPRTQGYEESKFPDLLKFPKKSD